MRRLLLGMVAIAIPNMVAARDEAPSLLLRRPDGSYQAPRIPGARSGDRLEVRPVPGTTSSAVYGKDGSRLGKIESRSYGGGVFYDRRGSRR